MLRTVRAVSLTNYVEVARFAGLDPYEMLRSARITPASLSITKSTGCDIGSPQRRRYERSGAQVPPGLEPMLPLIAEHVRQQVTHPATGRLSCL